MLKDWRHFAFEFCELCTVERMAAGFRRFGVIAAFIGVLLRLRFSSCDETMSLVRGRQSKSHQ